MIDTFVVIIYICREK